MLIFPIDVSLELKMIPWLFFLFFNGVLCLPEGAPKTSCYSLLPDHLVEPQTSAPPYVIHAELFPGQRIRVHVVSPLGERFEGFILQARSSENPNKFIDGKFKMGETFKTMNCLGGFQNTLTHVNVDSKTEIITEWIPKGIVNEKVIFRATIAKQFDIFWDKIDSNPLKVMSGFVPDRTTLEESVYKRCFKEEGCMGLPGMCVQHGDCQVILQYTKLPDGIVFRFQGILKHSQYMAMALSDDFMMGNDSVIECIRDGAYVMVRDSWNEGRRNSRTKVRAEASYKSSVINGITSCSWKTPFIYVANAKTYNFEDNCFHILLAKGSVSGGELLLHDMRIGSDEELNLTEYQPAEGILDSEYGSHVEESWFVPTTPRVKTSTNEVMCTTVDDASNSLSLQGIFITIILTGILFAASEAYSGFIFI